MPFPSSAEFLQLQRALAGRFSLERELGRGGMGVVFLARDVALDRPVAIKLLPLALAAEDDFRERFLNEARTAAKLSHPNIVPIHLVDARDNLVYFVMTFVDGETLGQRVRRAGPLAPSQVTRVVQEVAWALAYAHSRGVVHRDVKPDNILLDKDAGRAMVTDFGIARVTGAGAMGGTGEIVGTAHYMSPEQATGGAVDGRSDLFSLGVTAFYALTGTLPFDGPHLPAVVTRIVCAPAPRVADARAGVPVALADAVDRCLAKAPGERFATGEELAEAVGVVAAAPEGAPQVRFLLKSFHALEQALVASGFGLVIGPSILSALWASEPLWSVYLVLVLGSLNALFSYQVIYSVRQAIRAGLGPVDVRRAVDLEGRQRREEVEAVLGHGKRPSQDQMRLKRRNYLFAGRAALITLLGTIVVGALVPEYKGAIRVVLLITGTTSIMAALLGYAGAQGLKRHAAMQLEGKQPLMVGPLSRLLGIRFVDWLFRVAGAGLHVPAQNAPPASDRTEVLLAAAAGVLFKGLSPALRQRFAEVPRVVRRLEAEADLLRKREVAASRTGATEEAESARANARERLATAVAALENIRLDLLRLDAGSGTPDDLTADLEKARAISDAVDAELHGRAEVARILAKPR